MNAETKLTFLGGGNMAWALIQGLLRHGVATSQLCVAEPIAIQRARLHAEFGIVAVAENDVAARGAAMVVLAVKPQLALSVLRDLCPTLKDPRPVVLSIAAGVRIADLVASCPDLAVVRAMPNRPALVGAGVTALHARAVVSGEARALAEQVCGAVGRTVWVERESDLDIVTALSGSGPAYFFLLAEHLAAAATAQGLERSTAEMLAMQALRGAGAIVDGRLDAAAQRAAVTSPGGTTAAALETLAVGGFDKMVAAAVGAAATRGAELAALGGRREQFAPPE